MHNQSTSSAPLALPALYVHIPFCSRKCPYCAFYSEPIASHDPDRLVRALLRELDSLALSRVSTLYIGGGSPTSLPADLLQQLADTLINRLRPREATIEANPGQLRNHDLSRLRRTGLNRLSLGIQSFHPRELELLQRPCRPPDIRAAFHLARTAGFDNISLDLIFALPGSSSDDWQDNLRSALDLRPQHISAYSLTYEPHTEFTLRYQHHPDRLDEAADRALYEQTIRTLTAAGYRHVEISNFALPGSVCMHNLRYWRNLPVLGIGPAAASWNGSVRRTNIADITAYCARLENRQSPVAHIRQPSAIDIACETAVLNLRLIPGIYVPYYRRLTGFDPFRLFPRSLDHHRRAGNLHVRPARIALTSAALPIADRVLADFAGPDD